MFSVSENIQRFRKERGLTQEQLGSLVSVSAQAVSKWEKGGMPDAELLPAIADALQVTIDTLFGREDVRSADMNDIFYKWLLRQAEEKEYYELFKLLLLAIHSPIKTFDDSLKEDLDNILNSMPIKSSTGTYNKSGETVAVWLRSMILGEGGMKLSIPAEDCPLFMLLPEPEKGYLPNLLKPEEYRSLFKALAIPGSLELIFYLYSKPKQYYTQSAMEKNGGFEPGALDEPLEKLIEAKLLTKETIIETKGESLVYTLKREEPAIVPFLLLGRWILEAPGYIWSWSSRTRPILEPVKPLSS